jgi:hypothetical protein
LFSGGYCFARARNHPSSLGAKILRGAILKAFNALLFRAIRAAE